METAGGSAGAGEEVPEVGAEAEEADVVGGGAEAGGGGVDQVSLLLLTLTAAASITAVTATLLTVVICLAALATREMGSSALSRGSGQARLAGDTPRFSTGVEAGRLGEAMTPAGAPAAAELRELTLRSRVWWWAGGVAVRLTWLACAGGGGRPADTTPRCVPTGGE